MISARRFRYGGRWVEAGETIAMPPADERTHRLTGLVMDEHVEEAPAAPSPPKRRRKRK